MSEETRRKRKWDNQGEDDTTVKKATTTDNVPNATADTAATVERNDTPVVGNGAVAAAAAAIAAAKINAMLVAKGQTPLTSAVEADGAGAASTKAMATQQAAGTDASGPASEHANGVMPIKESKERDEFVADIDINDVKHRYILTKGSVQTQLQRDTNADVTTRGKHYHDRSMATEKDPPLYLHVTALTQEALDLAVKKINELIEEAQNPSPLLPQRESFQPQSRMPGVPPPQSRYQSYHTRVSIGIESERMFNVRAKIVGPGGQNVKHVQNVTRARVQLKGYGSGYLEADTGRESDEPLYINIIGSAQEDVDEAEKLCKDLVETIRAEYEKMKSRPPEPYGYSRHYGGRSGHHDRGHPHQRHQGNYHQQYQQQSPHQYGYNQQYQAHPAPPLPGVAAPNTNPPLPPGPPPPRSSDQSTVMDPAVPAAVAPPSAPADAPSSTATDPAAAAAAQGYTYEQYEAYNQYYYQQQYYQQYGQYYQQGYAQPGVEQGQGASAAAAISAPAPGSAPVSSDPALAYYGYAYAPPPPPPATADTAVAEGASSSVETAPPPPPPPVTASDA